MKERRYWLLGDVGSPVFPESWRAWPTELLLFDPSLTMGSWEGSLVPSAQLLSTPTTKTTTGSAIEAVIERTVDALVESQPDRLHNRLGDLTKDYPGRLSDVPWLPQTVEALRSAGLTEGASLNAVAATTWGEIHGRSARWLAVVDVGVALEHWVSAGGRSTVQDLDADSTLETIASSMCAEICRSTGADERAGHALRQRMGWGCSASTLDTIGRAIGVTRERARQVLLSVQLKLPPRVFNLPASVLESLELAIRPDVDRLAEEIQRRGLADTGYWELEPILSLVRALGNESLAEVVEARAHARDERQVSKVRHLKALAKDVRRARNITGFVDLRSVDHEGDHVEEDLAFESLSVVYPRCVRLGHWALAATQHRTLAETAALQQLAVAQPLSRTELWEGLDRARRKRNLAAIPDAKTVTELLSQLGTVSIDNEGLVWQVVGHKPPTLGKNEAWLLNCLQESEFGARHMDDVLEAARVDGMTESSIGVYCSFASFLRKKDGILFLVGREPDEHVQSLLRQVAGARRVSTHVEFTSQGDDIVVQLGLGTTTMNSGVIPIRRDLEHILGRDGRTLVCCPAWTSDARVNVSNRSSWYGFGALFRHWRDTHGVEAGNTVRLRVRRGEVLTDEIWAVG